MSAPNGIKIIVNSPRVDTNGKRPSSSTATSNKSGGTGSSPRNANSDNESLTSISDNPATLADGKRKRPVVSYAPPQRAARKKSKVAQPEFEDEDFLQPSTLNVKSYKEASPSPGLEESTAGELTEYEEPDEDLPKRKYKKRKSLPDGAKAPRKPARPKDVSLPTFTPVPTSFPLDEDFIAVLHIREFLVRFASVLSPPSAANNASNRNGKNQPTTRAAGWPLWLIKSTDGLCSLFLDKTLGIQVVEGLLLFAEREHNGEIEVAEGTKTLPKRQMHWSKDLFKQVLAECNQAIRVSPSEAWRVWTTLEEFLIAELFIFPEVAEEPAAAEAEQAPPAKVDTGMSSDLSDIEDSQQSPPKAGKAKANGQVKAIDRAGRIKLLTVLIDMLLWRSEALRVVIAEGIEKEKQARAKGFKIRKEFTEERTKLDGEKASSNLADWQAQVDQKTAEYDRSVADNYRDAHSQKLRWCTSKIYDYDIYIPTPAIDSTRYPAASDKEAIICSWSILFYGKPPTLKKAAPVKVSKRARVSDPAPSAPSAPVPDTVGWYSISSAADLETFANWLEGNVRWRVYDRKMELYEKGQDPTKAKELLAEEAADTERQEKEAIEFAPVVKAFADFVKARSAEQVEEEEEDEEEDQLDSD